ncbi:MAG: DUF4954 family protein [Calditrichaeota bacterium]|nr:MAG: DUF4954 family protein [Calditrichota bacterium]
MSEKKYFPLSKENISALIVNGCHAQNWSKVSVPRDFDPARIRNCTFAGAVEIGKQSGDIVLIDGRRKVCGIYNSTLENVTVGENCFLSNVSVGLTNLIIESGVVIENAGEIACFGESTFGNGHAVTALNEGGGRELKICEKTSAQLAYLTIFYRDNKQLIDRLNYIADEFCAQIKNNRATIGCDTQIKNCQKIINVRIGKNAILDGVLSLKNGTIDSSVEAATFVGSGVIAENFIFQKGASVDEGALISSSLIGEACKVGKQASIENSVLFANSEAFHSELCSVFGGPYTVTHHRSTLLIAGYFSFFNAGSATNQSNHMYKLGPVHQGILERGCKTGSSSYLLWPARVGAFSVVLGKHYTSFDTTNFPFSYLSDEAGKSYIIPAMNYFTTGTFRDGFKWPVRDKRINKNKLDQINFEILSPYTAQKIINGREILMDLYESSEKGQPFVVLKGIHIKRLLLKSCARYYQLILDKYFGDLIIKRAERRNISSLTGLFTDAKNGANAADEFWVDICGMLCRKSRIDEFSSAVAAGKIQSLEQINAEIQKIYMAYEDDEWDWFLASYNKMYKCELFEEQSENILTFMEQWQKSSLKLLNMVTGDAKKEFEGPVKTGFGIDGNQEADFENVRGIFEENSFKIQLEKERELVNSQFENIAKLIAQG